MEKQLLGNDSGTEAAVANTSIVLYIDPTLCK